MNLTQFFKKDGSNAAVLDPKVSEESLNAFFRQYNCTYKIDSTKEDKFKRYVFDFQGGHFLAFAYDNTPGIEFVFPRIFDVPTEHISIVRSVCNRGNNFSVPFKFSYNVSEEDNMAGVSISFYSISLVPSHIAKMLAQCFTEQREFIDSFKNAVENAKERNSADIEQTFAQNRREMFLMRQQELTHQDMGEVRTEPGQPFTLAHLVHDVMGRKDAILKKVQFITEDDTTVWGENDYLDTIDLTQMLLPGHNDPEDDVDYYRNDASMVVHYNTPLSESSTDDNVIVVVLHQESQDNHTFYYRVMVTETPADASRRNSLNSNNSTSPDTLSFLVGVDRASATQKRQEFDYMWKDAIIKINEGKENELSDEQRLIYDIKDANIGYNLYWGRHYMLKQRYYEAIAYFENAYHALRPIFFSLEKQTKQTFFDLCYYIGFCYNDLRLFDKAYFYLDIVADSGRIDYAMEYVNMLANSTDIRIFRVTDDIMRDIREQYTPDDEIPEKIQSFINFLRRRRAYAFIDFGNLDEAEKLFKGMLEEPENRDYAISELAYIKQLRGKETAEPATEDASSSDSSASDATTEE